MLDSERLEELLDVVTEKIVLANRTGELDNLLEKWELNEFIAKDSLSSNDYYDTLKSGKIVVIGASQVKEHDLLGIIKSLGIDKERFEFCLDYDAIESYNFKKMQWDINYRLVIVGQCHTVQQEKDQAGVL